jgi:hypothetical protein
MKNKIKLEKYKQKFLKSLREQKFNDSEKYLFKIAYYNNKEYFL